MFIMMETEGPTSYDPVAIKLIVIAGFAILIGINAQILIVPQERAWGFFEWFGFFIAAVLVVIAAIRLARDWLTRREVNDSE